MADNYDVLPDLARLLHAALTWGRDAAEYAERIAEHLALGEDPSAATVAVRLREALGVKACKCSINGGPGEVIPPACPVHGIACPDCGGLEECAATCGEACRAAGSKSGTVCGVTPAALYKAECGSGHPREARLCAGHAAADLWCRDCFEGGGKVRYVTPVPVPEAAARVTMPGRAVSGG
jgi:hypothetical protein